MNEINLQIDENKNILNKNELIQNIENNQYNREALRNLLQPLLHGRKEYVDAEEIISVLQAKIVELDNDKKEEEDINKENIESIKELNPNLKKLVVIETKKRKNDSEKDIDYLCLEDDAGNVSRMLPLNDGKIVDKYLNENPETASLTAEEFYEHFSKWIVNELEFNEINNYEELVTKSLIAKNNRGNVSEIIKQEIIEVESYKNKTGYESFELKYTVDSNGEVLYKFGPYIIKFHTVNDERVMDILHQPLKYDLTEDGVDKENVDSSTYDNYEIDEEPILFNNENLDKFKKLFELKEIEPENFSKEDAEFLRIFSEMLVEEMKKTPEYFKTTTDIDYEEYRNVLANVMDAYEKDIDDVFVSDLLEKYDQNIEEFENNHNLKKENNVKQKMLINHNEAGVALIVVILEIITLLLIGITFICLAI